MSIEQAQHFQRTLQQQADKILADVRGSVVCAWCLDVLFAGDPAKPISHGCCRSCAARLLGVSA